MPAGLPSFRALVEDVLAALIPAPADCEPVGMPSAAWNHFNQNQFDQAIEALEHEDDGISREVVRSAVRDQLVRKPITLRNHKTLLRLANLGLGAGCIVTTNFDRFFESAHKSLKVSDKEWPRSLTSYVGPTLPPPTEADGIVYLHGRLPENDGDFPRLVLSVSDFGDAYMLAGWARRYLVELFRSRTVVFIGYSLEDPVMRYLVAALAAARDTGHFNVAYVFAPFGGETEPPNRSEAHQSWRLKGLQPMPYDSAGRHQKLWGELRDWSEDHTQGVLGRLQKVARLGKFPPAQPNDPAIDEMVWALRREEVARHFATLKGADTPHPGWIAPLESRGLFALPVPSDEQAPQGQFLAGTANSSVTLHPSTQALAGWLTRQLDTREAVDWAIERGCQLHPIFRELVGRRLRKGPPLGEGAQKFWRTVSSLDYSNALAMFHDHEAGRHIGLGEAGYISEKLFVRRLRPIPIFRPRFEGFEKSSPISTTKTSSLFRVDLELIGIRGKFEIERVRQRDPNWKWNLGSMGEALTELLHEALSWLLEFEKIDRIRDVEIRFRTISQHPTQSEHSDSWLILIELVRDSFDALVETSRTSEAVKLAHRWKQIDFALFRRLCLYAAGGGAHAEP